MMTQQWLQQLATDATDGNPDSRSSSTLRSEHVESERMAMLAACAAANQAPAMVSMLRVSACERIDQDCSPRLGASARAAAAHAAQQRLEQGRLQALLHGSPHVLPSICSIA